MRVIETFLLILLLTEGIRTAYTDIKYGYIYNRDLAAALIPGTALNLIYYLYFVRDVAADYALNLILAFLVQLLLYKMNSYAGGDFKLGMVFSFLYPARMYVPYRGVIATLFFYIGIAIFYGYIYLLMDSIVRAVRRKSNLSRGYVFGYIRNFLISYIRASVYIFLITLASVMIGKYFVIPAWALWVLCMLTAWESRRRKIFRNKWVLTGAAAGGAALAVITKTIPFSIYPETYIFTAVLLIFQIVISSALYETIDTENIKKGMILSRASSVLMQNSRVKGLPGISSENLNDRLSREQAESVVRWGRTKNGRKQVAIMRKIPFAIFLLMGMATYFILWAVLYEM